MDMNDTRDVTRPVWINDKQASDLAGFHYVQRLFCQRFAADGAR